MANRDHNVAEKNGGFFSERFDALSIIGFMMKNESLQMAV